MYIDFQAKYFSNSTPISEESKIYYRNVLQSVFDQLSKDMELSALKSIVVPNDFKTDLFAFQEANGVLVECSDNDMGTVHGKVVTYIENGNTVNTIFFHKNLAYAIIDDTVIEAMADGEEKETVTKCRRLAINSLHHELAHVHENTISEKIYNDLTDEENDDSLLKTLRETATVIWEEYFACRFSASTCVLDFGEVENIIEQVRTVEEKIKIEINEYRLHSDINKLVSELQTRTLMLMNYSAYFQGHLFAINEPEFRNTMIKKVGTAIANTFFNKVWFDMNVQLNKLYDTYSKWKSRDVFDDLGRTVKTYWNTLGVYPETVEGGVYYAVPY